MQSYHRKRGRKNLWSSLLGILCFWIGVGWNSIHEHIQKRTDPPGWIFDAPYEPALFLSKIGLLVFVVATTIGIARLVLNGIFRLISKLRSKEA